MSTLDETKIAQIREDYQNSELTIKQIAEKNSVSTGSIYKYIKDLPKRNKKDVRRIKNETDKQLQAAIMEYKNTHESLESICAKYNISVSRLLDNCDFRRGQANKGRKYSLNEEKIMKDSREKFYWLGFISADGCIPDSRTLTIELKSVDREHLQKFANFLETDKPIKDRINNQGVECSRITINSINIINYLKQYNIVPNKSLSYTIPLDKIPDYYIYDFIRGLIDGDGSVLINNHQQISFSFCSGNKTCCEQVRKILNIDNKISFSGKVWRFSVTGNIKAKKILDKIYEHSNKKIRLDRKYNIYKTLN